MNRRLICIAALTVGACSWLLARGDAPTPNDEYEAPDRLRVAFVDVSRLFKNSTAFRAQMDEMKKKVEAAEEQVKEQQKRISELHATPQPDAPVQLPSEKNVDQLNSLLKEAVSAQREKFMKEEGVIYYDLSQKVDQEIERCAERHGIHVVFRVATDPVDPKDRADILRGINKQICYFDRHLDITDEVLAGLNKNAP